MLVLFKKKFSKMKSFDYLTKYYCVLNYKTQVMIRPKSTFVSVPNFVTKVSNLFISKGTNITKNDCKKTFTFCCFKSNDRSVYNFFHTSKRKLSDNVAIKNFKIKPVVKNKPGEFRRLLSLAKPEKWKIAGKIIKK